MTKIYDVDELRTQKKYYSIEFSNGKWKFTGLCSTIQYYIIPFVMQLISSISFITDTSTWAPSSSTKDFLKTENEREKENAFSINEYGIGFYCSTDLLLPVTHIWTVVVTNMGIVQSSVTIMVNVPDFDSRWDGLSNGIVTIPSYPVRVVFTSELIHLFSAAPFCQTFDKPFCVWFPFEPNLLR